MIAKASYLSPLHRILSRLNGSVEQSTFLKDQQPNTCKKHKPKDIPFSLLTQSRKSRLKIYGTYGFHPRAVPSPFPSRSDTYFPGIAAVATRPRFLAALVVHPTPLASEFYEFRTTRQVYTFFRTRDASRTGTLVIALSWGKAAQSKVCSIGTASQWNRDALKDVSDAHLFVILSTVGACKFGAFASAGHCCFSRC
jgi:hypothetical protein